MKITDDDVKRALAMLALEGEGTLLKDDAPDHAPLLVGYLRDCLQGIVDTRGAGLTTPPRLASIDTWEPFPDGWTVVNRTALRLGGRIDAKTTAQVLPGVSHLPSTFSGVFYGADLEAEVLRGDVAVYPPGVAVPKSALKFAPAVWAQRSQLCSTAKHARECAGKVKGTQYALNAESKAAQMEANEQRRSAKPTTSGANSFTAGKNPLAAAGQGITGLVTPKAEPVPPGFVRNSFGVITKASASAPPSFGHLGQQKLAELNADPVITGMVTPRHVTERSSQ